MRAPHGEKRPAGGNGERREREVLLADGEAHSRLALSLILRRAGFGVVATESSLEAVVGALSSQGNGGFDLLVIDPQGIGPTNDELRQALDRLNISVPVLFIDGFCTYPAGAGPERGHCLEKPFKPEEFLERIAQLVGEDDRRRGERS